MKLLLLLLVLLPWTASADAIFPPMISGEASVTIVTPPIELGPDGVTLRPPIQSVSLVSEGASIHCEPMANDETKPVLYTLANNTLGRVDVVAISYPIADCTGEASEPSTNTAYYFFVGPLAPDIAP